MPVPPTPDLSTRVRGSHPCRFPVVRTFPKFRPAVLFAGVVVLVVVLLSPVASAQTVADVESRDRLIANQEGLLNVYRCMFDVDAEIVPGGCADGKPTLPAAEPNPFTGTPTAEELAARDNLIGNQEALLNVYRCLFNIDTQIVPGGCVAGRPYPTFTAPPPPDAYAYTAVDAGWWDSCAIHEDKTSEFLNIKCWGHVDSRSGPPSGHYRHIASGGEHWCAIRSVRTIECWGGNDDGQANAPVGQFSSVSSGFNHSCAIRTDQTITCWGSSDSGQSKAPSGQFTDISTGNEHSCAIRTDQTVTCWGSNRNRQSNAPRGRFREIAGKGWHSCAIRHDWAVACWGYNYSGQADAPTGKFAKVAAGNEHSCAIRSDWTVTCWGQNKHGQIDAPQGRFVEITAANNHSCAIRIDHTIACWGQNDFGQTNAPLRLVPIQAVYAIPVDAEPVEGRDQAIAHEVTEMQRWFRSQTDGKHPTFARDDMSISVITVTLTQAFSEYFGNETRFFNEIYDLTGTASGSPLLILLEGGFDDTKACGWESSGRVVIPLATCSFTPSSNSEWPSGASYLIAHELTHLLGAVQPCAPNHNEHSPSHVNDSNRDLIYSGTEPGWNRDWQNLVLDFGNDDYYNHGRDDCYDIAHNPLLARE